MPTYDEVKESNAAFFELIASGQEKRAAMAVDDFTRVMAREDGFCRQILPPKTLSNSDLDRQLTVEPVKIVDKEPGTPPAVTIPFGEQPLGVFLRAPRYPVRFANLATPRNIAEINLLRTWEMDIRQVMSDNQLKDLLEEEDRNFLSAVRAVTTDTPGSNSPFSGNVHYEDLAAPVSRDAVFNARKILNKLPGRLEAMTVLVNFVFIKDVLKWERPEAGGDLSEEMLRSGTFTTDLAGVKWISTIKRNLVTDSDMYLFAEPKALGRFYVLQDVTLWIKNEHMFIEWFSWETLGMTIGNAYGVGRAKFTV